MEKLNLPPFTPGQKVVSLITCAVLKKGDITRVVAVGQCPKCKKWHISYDVRHQFNSPTFLCINFCGSVPDLSHQYWMRRADSFAPIQESKFKAVTFEKICEEVELICEN